VACVRAVNTHINRGRVCGSRPERRERGFLAKRWRGIRDRHCRSMTAVGAGYGAQGGNRGWWSVMQLLPPSLGGWTTEWPEMRAMLVAGNTTRSVGESLPLSQGHGAGGSSTTPRSFFHSGLTR
jgi:hypothetical protein